MIIKGLPFISPGFSFYPFASDKRHQKLIILDIGACTGEDAIRYGIKFPKAIIYAFEPLPKNIAVFKDHLSVYPNLNIKIVNTALSNYDGKAFFHVSGGNPTLNEKKDFTTLFPKDWNKSSSLLAPTPLLFSSFPWLKFNEQISVQVKKLATYLKEQKIPKVHFIHIDVQGAELLVFEGMEKYLGKVDLIWIEVSNSELYYGQPLSDEIDTFLKSYGFFCLKSNLDFNISGDSLYLNQKLHFKFKLKTFLTNIFKKPWLKK